MDSNNSTKYYCVFWYPTIFHREKTVRHSYHNEDLSISDGSATTRSLSFQQDKDKNLIFTIKDSNDKETSVFKFIFTKEIESRNGFVVYSYGQEVLNHFDKNDELDFVFLSCYHYAKTIYHEHEVNSESDARLKAYYYDKDETGNKTYITEQPDITKLNHVVIDFYLNQYESLFCDYYAENISKSYKDFMGQISKWQEQPKTLLNKLNSNPRIVNVDKVLEWFQKQVKYVDFVLQQNINDVLDIKKLSRASNDTQKIEYIKILSDYLEQNYPKVLLISLSKVLRLCGNALTEYTYCKTLLESKYNLYTHHNIAFNDKEIEQLNEDNCDIKLLQRDRQRKRAFNIRNSIRYIEGVRNKCDIWENELLQGLIKQNQKMLYLSNDMIASSEKSNKISTRLGWISLFLGILSVILGLTDGYKDIKSWFFDKEKPQMELPTENDSTTLITLKQKLN